MKILTFKRLLLVFGLVLGVMTVWSSAAPKTVDGIGFHGAGNIKWCNCTEAGTCSGTYTGCTNGYLARCHTGSGTDDWCNTDTGSTGGSCKGDDRCDDNSDDVKEQDCYSS
jgi:hypothetical protein